jgi:hypothetical protein
LIRLRSRFAESRVFIADFGLRIADFLLPKASAEAIRNPQSAIRNELQAVKQGYHLEEDILKHGQIKM